MMDSEQNVDTYSFPDDFDDHLTSYYERAIHPEDIGEVANQLAVACGDEDVNRAAVSRRRQRPLPRPSTPTTFP